MKIHKKAMLVTLTMASVLALYFTLGFDPDIASANAWEKAGITPDGSIDNSGIYDDLDKVVYFIMALGGFWILLCLVFAGVRLSAAQGNPQSRTQGFIGLGMAFLGGWVILKAYDIAGWIAGFGG